MLTSVTFPLGTGEKIVADLETSWRRKEGSRLVAEIPRRNWRGVRDSNPEVYPRSLPLFRGLPSEKQLLGMVFPGSRPTPCGADGAESRALLADRAYGNNGNSGNRQKGRGHIIFWEMRPRTVAQPQRH